MSDFTDASFKAITDFMDGRGYVYSSEPEEFRIGFTMGTNQADYRFSILIVQSGDYLKYVAYCPFRVDEKLRSSVAELIVRANYCLLAGKFEMDMSDGEVRFTLSHLIDGVVLSPETVGRLYRSCLFTLDRYMPAFMQHIHAGYTPEDAVFHAELDYHTDQVPDQPKGVKPKSTPATEKPAGQAAKKPQRRKPHKGQGELPF
jgi:hypothetical protein